MNCSIILCWFSMPILLLSDVFFWDSSPHLGTVTQLLANMESSQVKHVPQNHPSEEVLF